MTAVVVGDDLIALEPGDTHDKNYGLAVDVGTTTVVGALINLNTGAVEAVKSELNRQASFGADVISRVSHTMMEEGGLGELQARIIGTLNDLSIKLTELSGIGREMIYEAVIVGNATMLHILLGVDPEPISVAPFIPTITQPVTFRAADIGLRLHPAAACLDVAASRCIRRGGYRRGHFGTDLTRNKDGKLRLLIDVGTNGEIVLGSVNGTLATAAPAGPAFEGAQIKNGMRASVGAIEGITITADDVLLQIIGGDVKPLGIAGSGLVDAVAEMYRAGIVDASGRMIRGGRSARNIIRCPGRPSRNGGWGTVVSLE